MLSDAWFQLVTGITENKLTGEQNVPVQESTSEMLTPHRKS